jgi:hypothetical protein
MHSGAHIEYYTPSELHFSVETNDFFPHKFSHSWGKKNLGKIWTFLSCVKFNEVFYFLKFLSIFLHHKVGKKKTPPSYIVTTNKEKEIELHTYLILPLTSFSH